MSPHSCSVSQRQDGPHLKPAASPVPRPLGGASKLTLAAARALGGFTRSGRARGAGAKVCAPLGPLGQLMWGPGARRACTELRAALGRARARKGGQPRAQGPGWTAQAEGGESVLRILGELAARALLQPCRGSLRRPGPRPSRWRRAAVRGAGCRGPSGGSGRETPARSARSGSRAAGGGEINNARKRKTDVSGARASPASLPGCAPARAPRCRGRQRRCSDSSSPSSEAIVYWALNNLFIHPRGQGLPVTVASCS